MPSIEILGTGRIDDRESAFPQAVQLPNGDILCSFCWGEGPMARGGSDWARSTDGGESWTLEGTILPPTEEPPVSNALKLTISPDGGTVYAYGGRYYQRRGTRNFGSTPSECIICRSTDGGRTWSDPTLVPIPADCPLEVAFGAHVTPSGRLLGPCATLPGRGRAGEQTIAAISYDGGLTWPRHTIVFQDPAGKLGYIEHKFTNIAPDRVMCVAWTITMADLEDVEDSFAISDDDGVSWAPAVSTGIRGQTMAPLSLGGDRLLVLYNRRYGDQGIVMDLVTFTETGWTVHYEGMLYDPGTARDRPDGLEDRVSEISKFEFGFPTAIALQDGTYLATHWSRENGRFGVRWTKLRIDW